METKNMAGGFDCSRQTRREFLKFGSSALGSLAMAGAMTQALSAVPPAERRPNFVFFLGEGVRADEFSASPIQGWDGNGLSAMVNKIISTPRLDRIVHEGITFRNAFVVNALCLPSRATILTGLYSHRTGAIDNRGRKIPDSIPTIADLLRQAGYELAFFGKAHVKDLSKRDWDYYFGIEAAGANYYHPVLTESRNGVVQPPEQCHGYVDDLVADRALEWLNQKRDKPFCLFLLFIAPHAPFYRALRYANLYNGIKIHEPVTFNDGLKRSYPGKPNKFWQGWTHMITGIHGNDDPRSLEELVKDHCAGVVDNDDNAGRIMDALEKSGTLDDTAIILSSDHGFFLGEWAFYNKMLMHEPSIRVPLAMRYPRLIKAGTVSDRMALNLDIAPTILELAGVKVPEQMQGRSLIPLRKGSHVSNWRDDWLYEYYDDRYAPVSRGVRTERYKLIDYWQAPEEFELYDLQEDPGELRNLYGDPHYAKLTKDLINRIAELRKETRDV
jgi:arylsulfatase A-like enzyme